MERAELNTSPLAPLTQIGSVIIKIDDPTQRKWVGHHKFFVKHVNLDEGDEQASLIRDSVKLKYCCFEGDECSSV